MSISYKPYRMLRDRMAKMAAPLVSKKVRRMNPDDFLKYVINVSIGSQRMLASMDSNILVDEEMYVEEGCRAYFPESPALLEMLWRAKMDVTLDDLDLTRLPKVFSIAWPRTEIDGAPLIGCMVSIYANKERVGPVARFGQRYFGHPLELVTDGVVSDDEIGIHITYPEEKPLREMPAMYRCSIPNKWLKECLSGDVNFDKKLSTYRNPRFLAMSLSEQENHQQYVMAKLVTHLLVYMQACPDMISEGYPEGRKAREFSSRYAGKVKPTILGAPAGLTGTHASPDAHWRNAHFRSYPKRKDGTKKKGIVAVRGTMVNADVDPATVKEDELEVSIR